MQILKEVKVLLRKCKEKYFNSIFHDMESDKPRHQYDTTTIGYNDNKALLLRISPITWSYVTTIASPARFLGGRSQ